ncbi:MAG: Gfo/Idh/MocA family oxidoreductase [Planctomycetota bacterium]
MVSARNFREQPLRVAIVGAGRVARYHAGAVRTVGRKARLVGVTDTSTAKAQALIDEHAGPEVPAFDDVERMLAEVDAELVCVCTPPGSHTPTALHALRHGAWAFVEKPLCESLAQVDELAAAEAETGNRVVGVQQWRAGSGAKLVQRFMREGVFGRSLAVVANTLWYRDDDYYAVDWRGKWASEVGGTTVGHGIHTLDLMLALVGQWTEVRAMAATVARQIEVEDVSAAAVRFECGALASVMNSALSPRQESYLRLDCAHATVELRHFTFYKNDDWTITPVEGHEEIARRWKREIGDDVPPTQGSQLADVIRALEKGEDPATNLAEIRRTIEFVTALYKSAATGEPVTAGSITADDPWYQHVGGLAALAAMDGR